MSPGSLPSQGMLPVNESSIPMARRTTPKMMSIVPRSFITTIYSRKGGNIQHGRKNPWVCPILRLGAYLWYTGSNVREAGLRGEESMTPRHCLDVRGETSFSRMRGVCRHMPIVRQNPAGALSMRRFSTAPSGFIPRRFHPREQEIRVNSGSGHAVTGGWRSEIQKGAARSSPGEVERRIHAGGQGLAFLRMAPAAPKKADR